MSSGSGIDIQVSVLIYCNLTNLSSVSHVLRSQPSSDGIIPTAQHGQKAICKALNKYTLQVKEPRRAHRAAFIAVTVMAPNAARGHWYRDNSESRQVMQVGAISQLRHKIKLGNVNLPSAGNPDPWPAPGSLKELTPEDVNKVGGEPKWMRYPHVSANLL